jgi:hypothetical protein
MIKVIPDEADNVVAVSAHGTVSGEDYDKVLIPVIEERLKMHKKIRFLYHLGEDFSGYTPLAVWDDAKLGIQHLTAFEKIAVITEVPWVIQAVKFFGLFMPCPVKIFKNQSLAEARTWLRE